MAVKTGASPTVRGNRINDNKQNGVHVYDSGLGMVVDNDITGNAHAGVEVRTGGNPTVRRNRINRNGYQAVWIHKGGCGVIEDNNLASNKRGAWNIANDCEENVTRARNEE